MTRILVQRGSAGSSSSSNQNRSSTSVSVAGPSSTSSSPQQQVTGIAQVVSAVKDDNLVEEVHEQIVADELSEYCGVSDSKSEGKKSEDLSLGSPDSDQHGGEKIVEDEKVHNDAVVGSPNLVKGFGGMPVMEEENDATVGSSFQMVTGSSYPPPPPVPPPKLSSPISSFRRVSSGDLNTVRIGSSRRPAGWPGVSIRSSPTASRPSSPRSHCEGDGYNSADEQSPCFSSSYDDAEREHQFEIDLRRVKGLEVRKMLEDGNCLFRAVADQVYGDSELYDLVRQMCIDYMERERDHFSQFITEGFTSYCKRKRRDKVYGNNMEIQALSEMYNRPIHIYSYSTEPINIFHGSYNTDTPPIRLSYHHGNHYNSLFDPRRLAIGAGLGFSSLQGTNVDKDQVKAAIKAQQDQQIDNALLAEGRFYSDLELTEKEIERMVMEASRAEYLADDKFKQQLGPRESSTSRAEPSSSAATGSSGSDARQGGGRESGSPGSALSGSMQIMLSMGFSYLQVMEAYSIFGDDVDSMVCYLIETSSNGRRKGKAAE
ncbi:OTU domain-containing protein 5 isoform X1 [Sesamum indicum]|uniref:OTU domain-containing protein 5 isoform X1 n=1 Tax=Sesamum indicum TaxID=4182 RepID=A0A6I9TT03_SESIN|nr:OTU domain-containing protein 5 isoform X1 [Sesamum indicum]XP_011088926.1 OTU domain-containing protein 5 isoform X1 [Sesamum indicum]XP_011088927.1 OTU domain-containing protein 5 isoform X1 [Sesamum indicum]XP_011088928.1 OTU domain-containing protein 5 isoform X1 [Sesamum indicum]XP_020552382.1 OTU domain-containing protein 5 isoform X1 [Sesamum indicum]XP_020552384.1 OTU domain-containing protein 5 isoform X1 [Sesamum indicum]